MLGPEKAVQRWAAMFVFSHFQPLSGACGPMPNQQRVSFATF
jgi:hypothetical protein